MHKHRRQQFQGEAAHSAQPARKSHRVRCTFKVLLATGLLTALQTSVFSQHTTQQRAERLSRSSSVRHQVVELLPPVFESVDSNRSTQNDASNNRRLSTVSANSPPQRKLQPFRRPSAARPAETRVGKPPIVQTSHAPLKQRSSPIPRPDRGESIHQPIPEPDHAARFAPCPECEAPVHRWQLLPDGLLYKSYVAGEKEPRFAAVWLYESGRGWVWETTLGGRVGLVRYGTPGAVNPEGWQIDIEGAAFPRIDPEESSEMDAVDFRAGCVWTWRRGPLAVKAGYYHISSHIGDEYLLRTPTFRRIEYVRDAAILGMRYDINPALTTYGEVGYAVGHTGGAEPLELQFGLEYSPRVGCDWRGAPFAAINGHLREDFNFGGNLNVVAGRQWRGPESDHVFRAGVMYFNGKSLQYQFFDKDEELLGAGIWFDY